MKKSNTYFSEIVDQIEESTAESCETGDVAFDPATGNLAAIDSLIPRKTGKRQLRPDGVSPQVIIQDTIKAVRDSERPSGRAHRAAPLIVGWGRNHGSKGRSRCSASSCRPGDGSSGRSDQAVPLIVGWGTGETAGRPRLAHWRTHKYRGRIRGARGLGQFEQGWAGRLDGAPAAAVRLSR